MLNPKKDDEKSRKGLDRTSVEGVSEAQEGPNQPVATSQLDSKKKVRGRPRKIPPSWVTGRAYNYGLQLGVIWSKLEAPLLSAQTAEEVTTAFENYGQPYASDFVPEQAADILVLIRNAKFPKHPEAQINFLADSLSGRPRLSLRTSRDICEKERARQRRKSQHRIIRHEFYIECSCGYKGPARDNACRKCGAEILSSIPQLIGRGLF